MFGNKNTDSLSATSDTKKFILPGVVTAVVEKSKAEAKAVPGTIKIPMVAEPSVLSAGAVFIGSLTSPGAVHAQGKLEGELTSPHVTLGSSGEMSGRLKCQNLVIDGKFDGDLECEEAIAGSAAVMDGRLICKSLEVAPGAKISGSVEIGKR